jgi:hypothetical protein
MNSDELSKINNQIYKQFPYLTGKEPEIVETPDGLSTLKYSGNSKTANGHKILISIKVKISEDGKILHISSSK